MVFVGTLQKDLHKIPNVEEAQQTKLVSAIIMPDRVAIWKRYYDTMQLKSSGSYCILEHFADNSEEIELSNYGMMTLGKSELQFFTSINGLYDQVWDFSMGALFRSWLDQTSSGYLYGKS